MPQCRPLAGFIESYGMARDKDGAVQHDCLLLAIRQTPDPDSAIPVRVYGRFSEAFLKTIQIAMPVLIEGRYMVKVLNEETEELNEKGGKIIKVTGTLPYIHCANIKQATPDEIKVRPPWWAEMKDRLLKERRERAELAARAQMAAAKALGAEAGVSVDQDL